METVPRGRDSFKQLGGIIPGTPGIHAFSLSGLRPSAIPVLIAAPHAGRAYPEPVLRSLRSPESTAMRLEDRLVDSLARAVATETGAVVLVANAPRAMIDLNRAPEDLDWEMFRLDDRPDSPGFMTSHRARSGLGLIPRRVPGVGELWKAPQDRAELAARMTGIHGPYHDALATTLAALRSRWGAALLLDFHSMPPIPATGPSAAAKFVVGDRFGASSDGSLVAAMSTYLDRHGRVSAYNRPYAGGHVLDRHGDPARGVHAIQIEIDRSTYLDAGLSRLGDGYPRLVRLLSGLVRLLAAEVTVMGDNASQPGWREAAE